MMNNETNAVPFDCKDAVPEAAKLAPAGAPDGQVFKSDSGEASSSISSFAALASLPMTPAQSTPDRSDDDDPLVPSIRRASTMESALEEQPPRKAPRHDFADFAFVTFFVLGDKGDSGHTGFQLTEFDTKYAQLLEKHHPGSRLVLLTDEHTQFDFNGVDIEEVRYNFDRAVLGRNAYANKYQFEAQLQYLRTLQAEGARTNVVFMDNDIFIVKSIAHIFEHEDFHYGCTISDSKVMPVNIGMQFVKAGWYGEAIRFLEAVLQNYRLDPVEEFCAGQISIAEVLGLYADPAAQIDIWKQAAKDSYAVRTVGPGQHKVAFLSCMRYNYCNLEDSCCTDPLREMDPLTCPKHFMEKDVCALHFVGWRKSGMPAVFEAFMRNDLETGFQAFIDKYNDFVGYGNHGHHDRAVEEPGEVEGFYKLGFA